ncbi:MAG: hypothetical protein Q8P18_33460 [Pseudomonadota bacterium]|nr:hypothetical protein [Pseudomonadota bacterium]
MTRSLPRLRALPLLLALPLAACTWDVPETCDDLPEPPDVGACFGNPGLDYPGYGTAELSVTGTVTSVTTAPVPDACDVRFFHLAGSTEDAVVLVVADADGVETTVGLTAPDLVAPVVVGDTVSLDLAYTFGEFGPDEGHVVLADGAGIERVVIGVAGSLADLATPADVVLEQGGMVCTQHDECGTWSAFDFTVSAEGDVGSVPYGQEAAVGPWRVVHAGDELQAINTGGVCPDWFVAHVAAAFVRE